MAGGAGYSLAPAALHQRLAAGDAAGRHISHEAHPGITQMCALDPSSNFLLLELFLVSL